MKQTLLFDSNTLKIGKFDCPVDSPRFDQPGRIYGQVLVFPEQPIIIEQAGKRPVVADSNVAMFYNHDQEYCRYRLSDYGDYCHFIGFEPELVNRIMAAEFPELIHSDSELFGFCSAPTLSSTYKSAQQLFHLLESDAATVALAVESFAIELLHETLRHRAKVIGLAPVNQPSTISNRSRKKVFTTQKILADRFCSPISLAELSQTLNTDKYYLCKVFKQHTGVSIHQYLLQLRLRASLTEIPKSKPLTRLAVDLGFASPSHFSYRFQKLFDMSPTEFKHSVNSATFLTTPRL